MTPAQLKTIRKTVRLSQVELAEMLQTSVRTYQDWEGGRGRIPGIMAVTLGLLMERDEKVTKTVLAKIAARIERDCPEGIPSEIQEDEES